MVDIQPLMPNTIWFHEIFPKYSRLLDLCSYFAANAQIGCGQ